MSYYRRFRYRRTDYRKVAAAVGVALALAAGAAHHHGHHHHGPPPAASASAAAGGSNEQLANRMAASGYGWTGGQRSCLDALWTRESGFRTDATNPQSGAFGIPQSLPPDKMAAAGSDWQTNPVTQIRWGLGYISTTYGSACGAWSHELAASWY